MKKLMIIMLGCAVFCTMDLNTYGQLGGLLNKVKNKVIDKALGTEESKEAPKEVKAEEEPICACVSAIPVLKFSESIKLDYKEAVFSILDDGTLLVFNKIDGKYYTVKNGSLVGPYNEDDPVVKQFQKPEELTGNNQKIEDLMARYKGIIIPSGEKYSIVFGGKTYGPYAIIQTFICNKSNTKFAAIVTENVLFTEKEAAKIEEALNNAKSDQEKMQLAMQANQQLLQNVKDQSMVAQDGNLDITPKIVSNVPGAQYDIMAAATFSNKIKYDEIVYVMPDKIADLTGKTLFSIDTQKMNNNSMQYWLSSDNSVLATINYGIVSFSDGRTCPEVFCPYLVKKDGKVYLTYMYFSPKNNAIMQCEIPF